MLIDMFHQAGILAKLGILLAFAPTVAALLYAIKPSERRLALMRPISLAAVFSGLTTFTIGVIVTLQGIAATAEWTRVGWSNVALGASEAFVALFVAFANLTIAWLLVALGLRRTV